MALSLYGSLKTPSSFWGVFTLYSHERYGTKRDHNLAHVPVRLGKIHTRGIAGGVHDSPGHVSRTAGWRRDTQASLKRIRFLEARPRDQSPPGGLRDDAEISSHIRSDRVVPLG